MSGLRIIVIVGLAIFVVSRVAGPSADLWGGEQDASVGRNPAPSAEQIRALFARLAENQHRNDRALEEYERIEHTISRRDGENSAVLADHTSRVMSSGTGIMRFETAQDGVPVSRAHYRHDLQIAIEALTLALHPNEREKQDLAKFEKRRRDRAELVDAALKGFRATWVGRETRGSRTLAKFLIDPNPDFKPNTRVAEIFEHIHATMWVDESEAQMARVEGDITSDIGFGGGILGKVYRGGHFMMEQAEMAPGVWLPTLYIYDVDGRKFLFGFTLHERTEVSHYRRLGPPSEAIAIIRKELDDFDQSADPPGH